MDLILKTIYFMSLPAGVGILKDAETKTGQLIQALFLLTITIGGSFLIKQQYAHLFLNWQYAVMAILATFSQFLAVPAVNHFKLKNPFELTPLRAISLTCYANIILALLVIVGHDLNF